MSICQDRLRNLITDCAIWADKIVSLRSTFAVAFLVAGAAATAGKEVTMVLTKEAVRLALPGIAEGTDCDGCPPLPTLATQFAEAGGRLLVCPAASAPGSSP